MDKLSIPFYICLVGSPYNAFWGGFFLAHGMTILGIIWTVVAIGGSMIVLGEVLRALEKNQS